ncbi:MAG: cysteine-rich small domain-containing protein [Clostridia bacterium]|nr:cysteine-rich small domain-containing protein [Clostridia bacterium]
MKNNSSYFKNDECEYFPCHKKSGEYFNCMFCHCPLYALGDKCGGNFVYILDGIKDCSNCVIPHSEGGVEHVRSKLREVSELAKKNRGEH